MGSMLLERKLRNLARRLHAAREELAIAEEQHAHFADISDETRLRSLVSETPLADEDHRHAERTTAAMARHRAELIDRIARLEREQDELLDRLMERRRG